MDLYTMVDKLKNMSEGRLALDKNTLNEVIEFISNHPSFNKCEVDGCFEEYEYSGWYRCKDKFTGKSTGLIQRRLVCELHSNLLIGNQNVE